ncbi:MAG: radical SAM protein, partial [Chlamydiales bacterium]|nr:radical SAM protein [Chlamydiales bacterium]
MTTICPNSTLLRKMPDSLFNIAEKVIQGVRLDFDDALVLLNSEHTEAVRILADYRRQEKLGDVVYYASTLYIHPTNLCELSCPMCSFYAKPGWKNAWFTTPEQ